MGSGRSSCAGKATGRASTTWTLRLQSKANTRVVFQENGVFSQHQVFETHAYVHAVQVQVWAQSTQRTCDLHSCPYQVNKNKFSQHYNLYFPWKSVCTSGTLVCTHKSSCLLTLPVPVFLLTMSSPNLGNKQTFKNSRQTRKENDKKISSVLQRTQNQRMRILF